MRPIVLIPARLAAMRLPNKPVADIHGEPMIVHVWRRGLEADVGPVVVAAGDPAIADAIRAVGGHAVLTDPALPSGSDRVWAALQQIDPDGKHDIVVNLQGDLPTIAPDTIRTTLGPLANPAVDISTLATVIKDEAERDASTVVKIALSIRPGESVGRAIYFSRTVVPTGPGDLYHHVGLYTYRRSALARFVALPPGILEQREKLEQLRALEDGMRIDAAVIDAEPLGVDVQSDLERARMLLAPRA